MTATNNNGMAGGFCTKIPTATGTLVVDDDDDDDDDSDRRDR
jgi:hypothetical protein